MGRTAQPAALKLLKGRGNGRDSGGRKVQAGPGFRRLPPEKPEWLTPEAAAEWDRVLPELLRLEVVKEGDGPSLAAYCEAWSLFVTATKAVRVEGLTVEGRWGPVANPSVAVQQKASATLRGWASHFGLTPATEQKLKTAEPDDDGDSNPF